MKKEAEDDTIKQILIDGNGMNRKELETYIAETYSAQAEHPWMMYPDNTVFRHADNKKWFALVMSLSESRLGLAGEEKIDVMNLKCDPILVGSLLNEKGFFPAYHMSKTNWITIALDGSADDEKIKWLIDLSFELTAVKIKKPRGGEKNV